MTCRTKILMLLALLTIGMQQVSAQQTVSLDNLLKAFSASKDSGSSTTSSASTASGSATTDAGTADSCKIKWNEIPVYTAQRVNLTDEQGNQLYNEDGTPQYRVFLVDQYGNKRSKATVDAQVKKINNAVGRIVAKVGISTLAGFLLADKKHKGAGAAIGAVVGGLLSINDIKMASKMKKSLKNQKRLLEAYSKSFTEEGLPVEAQVDMNSLKVLDLKDDKTLAQTSDQLRREIESRSFTDSSIQTLDDFDFDKL